MAIPGKNAWDRSFFGRKLTAEANGICFSRRQSRRMRISILSWFLSGFQDQRFAAI